MTVKEWLIQTYKKMPCDVLVREQVMCKDGFAISIQASRGHYCVPRTTIADGNYTHLELGFSTEEESLLEEYKRDGIYPYVPIEIVEKVINKHGGIDGGF